MLCIQLYYFLQNEVLAEYYNFSIVEPNASDLSYPKVEQNVVYLKSSIYNELKVCFCFQI